jgi:hypothetical protein
MVLGTTLCDKVCQSLSYGTWYNIVWSSLTIVIIWYSVQHYVVKFDNDDHMVLGTTLLLYRVPYDHDCQTLSHNVVPSTIWSRLSNVITQCCTEYHMITIVKFYHTMLYQVPYDSDCQTWPHNVVPSTIWSRLSNVITQCCTEYHMITIVKLYHTMLYRVPYDHDCQTLSHNVVPSTIW